MQPMASTQDTHIARGHNGNNNGGHESHYASSLVAQNAASDRDIGDPTSGRQQDPIGTQSATGLNSSSLPGDMSHQVFESRYTLSAFSTSAAAYQAFVGCESKDHEEAKQFSTSTAYTRSSLSGTMTPADQKSMTESYYAQRHDTSRSQTPNDLGQTDPSTIGLDHHWLSLQGPYTGQILMCPYHDPILQVNTACATQGLGPMARYLAVPASEQYAIFSRPDTGDLSTSKGCRCLEMLQLNIETEEDTQK